ncbi:hypothetical protein SDC9_99504 [bioreactor metagenome]|uniref:Antibiotic biosynthesis monooxygenase n=1 Tax=bioreactor metagenome TaxID=1076179 RepID=A0A645AHQ4_9ZZZZ
MKKSFSEVKLFQVKPDKSDEFETLIANIANEQKQKSTGHLFVKFLNN